ncbi:sodium-independent sulfate anion transporter-like isoform X2 [Liolophura sinensis]|uniref:sodium-independent sulfate anion transporter-like isoform X2 n=1 Tax=Liolophura sinensis TaxID=3198878 RepID=UPI003158D9E1
MTENMSKKNGKIPEGPDPQELKIGCCAKVKTKVKSSAHECCSMETLKSRLPIIKWLPKYTLLDLQCDIIAGLTVGLTVIPQGLAYARVAQLPPQYGLYSAFMGCFLYIFLGTSKDITLGPTALMSLMTAAFAATPVAEDPTFAIILCLFCGIIQFTLGILKLGVLVNFISFPVINGFTSAAAIIIAVGQIKDILGLSHIPREFLHQVYETALKIPETNVWDLCMGLVCLVILIFLKQVRDIKWKEESPEERKLWKEVLKKLLWLVCTGRNAVIVIATAGIAGALEAQNITELTLTGELVPGLPEFRPPSFTFESHNITMTTSQVFEKIGAGFAIVPLLGIIETVAIGKAFARKNNYKLDPSQELIAIGVGNLISSFFGAYPITGSFSRTAVNSQSGVATPMGGLVTGALVLLALGLLTPWFYYIPRSSLAAVIISAVIYMVDYKIVLTLWRVNKIDLIPLFVTFILSFLIGIEYGILAGVGVSIVILLYPLARPKVKTSQGALPLDVFVDKGLAFPSMEYIQDTITSQAANSTSPSVVLDCKNITELDYSAVQGLLQLQSDVAEMDKVLVLKNLKPSLRRKLETAGMKDFQYFEGEDDGKVNGDSTLKISELPHSISVSVEEEENTTKL